MACQPRRSGPKRLGSRRCGVALTTPGPTDVGPPLLFLTPGWGGVSPLSSCRHTATYACRARLPRNASALACCHGLKRPGVAESHKSLRFCCFLAMAKGPGSVPALHDTKTTKLDMAHERYTFGNRHDIQTVPQTLTLRHVNPCEPYPHWAGEKPCENGSWNL